MAGEAFTVEMVQDVARMSYGEVLDGLDELLDRHLVRESTGHRRYEYAFTHHLIHAAIYDGVPADARLRRHRRIARILDTSANSGGAAAVDEGAREIAFHYERGGEATRAAHYYAVARRAAALYANEEARGLIDLSRKLDPQDDRRQFELLLLRSRLNARLGDANAERADVQALDELAERLDPDAKGNALLRHIDLAVRQADRERECEGIERLRAHAIATSSDRWLAAADEAQAGRDFGDGKTFRAIDRAVRARERYQRIGDDAACARVIAFAARAALDDYERSADSERLSSEALRLAQRVGDPEARISALCEAVGVAATVSMDNRRAVELCQAALAIAIEIGDRAAEVRCRRDLGIVLTNDMQIEAATIQLRKALQLCESLALTERLPSVMGNLGFALLDVDLEAALDWSHRAADYALERGSMRIAASAFNNVADAAWQLGDLLTMSATLEKWRPIIESQSEHGYLKSAFFQVKARLLRCRRRFDDSIMELQKLLATLENDEPRMSAYQLKMIAEAYEDLSVTQFCSGRLTAARQSIEQSTEVTNRNGKEPQTLIRRHWIDACLCRAEGRPNEARLALGRASEIYRVQLGRLVDPGLRAAFVQMPLNRAIRVALERDEWPAPDSPCIVAFPGPAGSPGSPPFEPARAGVGASAQA